MKTAKIPTRGKAWIFFTKSQYNLVSQWVTSSARCASEKKIVLFWITNLSLSWHLINEVNSSVSNENKNFREKILTLDTYDTWELHSSEASYPIRNTNNNPTLESNFPLWKANTLRFHFFILDMKTFLNVLEWKAVYLQQGVL